jgi:hypothetical protein
MRRTLARAARVTLSVLALASCGSKKEQEQAPPPAAGSAAGAAEPARGSSAAQPTQPPAAGSAVAGSAAAGSAAAGSVAAPSSALPAECNEYRETVQRLASCGDALPPATRDNLQKQFEQQWAGWEKLPEQDRRTLASICKSSADSVKAAAAAACHW